MEVKIGTDTVVRICMFLSRFCNCCKCEERVKLEMCCVVSLGIIKALCNLRGNALIALRKSAFKLAV